MCGVFGFTSKYKVDIADQIAKNQAIGANSRGGDATGVAYLSDGEFEIKKRPVDAYDFNDMTTVPVVNHLIGHTRLTTQGSQKKNNNNHPFFGRAGDTKFTLAHNGVLTNDKTLRTECNLPKTKIQTDSYIVVQLIESQGSVDFDSIRYASEKLQGTFVLTILDESGYLWLVKHDNPLMIADFYEEGLIMYGSTSDVLNEGIKDTTLVDTLWEQRVRIHEPKENTITCITPEGEFFTETFTPVPCSYGYGWMPSSWDIDYYAGKYTDDYTDIYSLAYGYGYCEEEVDRAYELGYTEMTIRDAIVSNYLFDLVDDYLDYGDDYASSDFFMEYLYTRGEKVGVSPSLISFAVKELEIDKVDVSIALESKATFYKLIGEDKNDKFLTTSAGRYLEDV